MKIKILRSSENDQRCTEEVNTTKNVKNYKIKIESYESTPLEIYFCQTEHYCIPTDLGIKMHLALKSAP